MHPGELENQSLLLLGAEKWMCGSGDDCVQKALNAKLLLSNDRPQSE